MSRRTAKTGDTINFEGVSIMYPNFNGDPTPYNPNGGKRTFSIRINDLQTGQDLMDAGWNVKSVLNHDEGDEIAFFTLPVEVKYNENYRRLNPTVYQVTSHNKVKLDQDTVGILDNVDIREADLIVRAYEWEVGDRSGIKAYLQTGYFVIEEDQFARKYEFDDEVPF